MADPPDSEAATEPALAVTDAIADFDASSAGGDRVVYVDASGRRVAKEQAHIAVIREFDDRGNVVSMMTERLAH